jgi:hypothetical protein
MSSRESVLYSGQSLRLSGRWTLLWLSIRNHLDALMGAWREKTRASARLRHFEYVDPHSSESVSLTTSREYSVLSIGGRRFYFGRISGNFDGVSCPLAAPTAQHPHFQ